VCDKLNGSRTGSCFHTTNTTGEQVMSEHNVDLDKPTVAGLIYLLRHQELWPAGFEWNVFEHDKCAIGLMQVYWNIQVPNGATIWLSSMEAADILGMSHDTAYDVFINELDGATAHDIANRLEAASQ
jgi:hypothetical protein